MPHFKHLDVRHLPKGWQGTFFGDLAEFRMGKTPRRNNEKYWNNGHYPWVSIADMEPFGSVIETKEKVSRPAHREVFHEALVPAGSLLMSFKLTIGRMARLAIPAYHNEAIISFRPHAKLVDIDFLFYYMGQIDYRDYQDTAVKGQTLNKGKLKNLEIALPPLSEQRTIARVIGLAHKVVEQQARLLQLTRELKAHLMHILFSEGLRGEPKRQTDVGPIPKSWRVAKFTELFGIKHGYAFDGKFFKSNGKFVLLTPGHFFEHGGFRDQKEKTKYYTGKIPPGYLLNEGDLLVAMTEQKAGLLGSSVLIPQADRFVHNQRLGLIVDLKTTRLNKLFLFYLFNTPRVRKEITKTASGSKVRHTSPKKILDVLIGLPSLQEQQQIVEAIQAIDARIDALSRKHDSATDLFHTLLHQLMTGQLRVNDIDLSDFEMSLAA